MRITNRCSYGVDLHHKGARCSVVKGKDGYLNVFSLYTEHDRRNKGDASILIRAIKRYAKKKGLRVALEAAPFRDQPMRLERLVLWYERRGFIKTNWPARNSIQPMEYIP